MVLCTEDNSKWEEIQEARAEEKAEALQVEKHFEQEAKEEVRMQLHQLGDLIQDLRHEGHNLAQVHFKIDDVSYVLKSIDVADGSVTIRLQTEPQQAVHEGFLALGKSLREKSSKSLEKT